MAKYNLMRVNWGLEIPIKGMYRDHQISPPTFVLGNPDGTVHCLITLEIPHKEVIEQNLSTGKRTTRKKK